MEINPNPIRFHGMNPGPTCIHVDHIASLDSNYVDIFSFSRNLTHVHIHERTTRKLFGLKKIVQPGYEDKVSANDSSSQIIYPSIIGSTNLPLLINSFISANFPAIAAYIFLFKPTTDVGGGFKLQIDEAVISPENVKCIAGDMSLSKHSNSRVTAKLTILLRKGTIIGRLLWKVLSSNVRLSWTNLQIHLLLHIDWRQHCRFPIELETLKCSIEGYELDCKALSALKPILRGLPRLIMSGASPDRIAFAINETFNSGLVSLINSELAKNFPSIKAFSPRNDLNVPSEGIRQPLLPNAIPANLDSWMSHPKIQRLPLTSITLPGTHDSAAYDLSSTLSQIAFEDTSFLWSLRPTPAIPNGKFPISSSTPLHLGPALYKFAMNTLIPSIAQSQGLPIRAQLESGIRWLDLRVYFDTNAQAFYTQHALRGPSLADILEQVNSFFAAHAESRELVVARLAHSNLATQPPCRAGELCDLITRILHPRHIFCPASEDEEVRFDVGRLAHIPLSEITGEGSKIMFVSADPEVWFPVERKAVLNVACDVSKVQLATFPRKGDVVRNVCGALSGSPSFLLKEYASVQNERIAEELKGLKERPQVVALDWADARAVETIVRFNFEERTLDKSTGECGVPSKKVRRQVTI